jgi:hypothetical protein
MKSVESNVVGSLFWMMVGALFAVGGVRLNLGTLHNPGPGFLPTIMAGILILFSLFGLLKGLIKPDKFVSRISWTRHALAVAAMFLYGLLLGFIGFLVSTFILMFILFGFLTEHRRKWIPLFLYAAVTAFSSWLIFSVLLRVPFPFPSILTLWR